MNEEQVKQAVVTTYCMRLAELDNLTLAVLNNHINGWGKVNPAVPVFDAARGLDLVREDGMPKNEFVAQALTAEVFRRLDAGVLQ